MERLALSARHDARLVERVEAARGEDVDRVPRAARGSAAERAGHAVGPEPDVGAVVDEDAPPAERGGGAERAPELDRVPRAEEQHLGPVTVRLGARPELAAASAREVVERDRRRGGHVDRVEPSRGERDLDRPVHAVEEVARDPAALVPHEERGPRTREREAVDRLGARDVLEREDR